VNSSDVSLGLMPLPAGFGLRDYGLSSPWPCKKWSWPCGSWQTIWTRSTT